MIAAAECRKCHRPIADAKKYHGYGPRCWRAVQPQPLGAIIRALPIARRAAEHVPGQLELDIEGGDA